MPHPTSFLSFLSSQRSASRALSRFSSPTAAASLVFACGLLGATSSLLLHPTASAPAHAATTKPDAKPDAKSSQPDPTLCQAYLADMGDVGLRITDAQAVAEAVVLEMRKRLGREGVVYEGVVKGLEKMQNMLGAAAPESSPQTEQIAYYRAAMSNAHYRIVAKFDKKGSKHTIRVACYDEKPELTALAASAAAETPAKPDAKPDAKLDAKPDAKPESKPETKPESKNSKEKDKSKNNKAPLVEELLVEGDTFLEARDALVEKLPTFCAVLKSNKPVDKPAEIPFEKKPLGPPPEKKKPSEPWAPPPRRD